jgi:hypothetical protein
MIRWRAATIVPPSFQNLEPGRCAGLFSYQETIMTDATQPFVPATAASDWLAMEREYARVANELRPANKTALFDVLAAAGITIVRVAFDGEGDSGQIEDITATNADTVIELPPDQIEIAFATWGQSDVQRRSLSVHDAIEQLAYDLLGETHGGWENSDGAYGEFTFDVEARTITLAYNERHMDSDYSEHVF